MNRRDEAVKEGPPALCKDAFQDGSRTGSRHKVPDLFIHFFFLFNPFFSHFRINKMDTAACDVMAAPSRRCVICKRENQTRHGAKSHQARLLRKPSTNTFLIQHSLRFGLVVA